MSLGLPIRPGTGFSECYDIRIVAGGQEDFRCKKIFNYQEVIHLAELACLGLGGPK
jgi:hypothetical protein